MRRSGCRSGRHRSSVTFALDFDGAEVRATIPAQYRYEGNIFSGEKRMELHVVPQVTLRTSPGIAILPHAPDRRSRPAPRLGPT